jgi:DNA-directed RNA polymerase I subunit RPA1
MDDLRLTQQGRETREKVLAEKVGAGRDVAIEYVGLKGAYDEQLFKERMEEVIRDPDKLSGLDKAMQNAASDLTSDMYRELVPGHLVKKFPKNNMQNMTESKAKGTGNNANLISSIIGTLTYDNANFRSTIAGRWSSPDHGQWENTPVVSCI